MPIWWDAEQDQGENKNLAAIKKPQKSARSMSPILHTWWFIYSSSIKKLYSKFSWYIYAFNDVITIFFV